MQKLFGIVFIACAVWVGLEVYQKGTAGALEGILASFGLAERPAEDALPYESAGDRAAARVRDAHQASFDRAERPEAAERIRVPAQRLTERLREKAGR